MIRTFVCADNSLKLCDAAASRVCEGWVWLDLHSPTSEEKQLIGRELGLDIPTEEEMQEIEVSSRLYREDGAHFMTATVLTRVELGASESAVLTLVLHKERLITVHYAPIRALELFVGRAAKPNSAILRGMDALLGVLDSMVNRTADALELTGAHEERTSQAILNPVEGKADRDYQGHIQRIGQMGDLTSRCRESLASIERVATFLVLTIEEERLGKDLRARARAVVRDARSLIDHASFMAGKINFLLDATLGMVNIEQNTIIKIFSVAAVVFLPPTLIASVYGMNFHSIPELSWPYGYPLAIVLMVLSALLPLWWFKKRGWL